MRKSDLNSDAQLVLSWRSGDRSALAQLVKIWHKRFCEKAYWMVKDKDAAKDIAQESWTIIIKNIDTLNNPNRFKYWAYRIVCNRATDWLRLQAKTKKRSLTHVADVEGKAVEDSDHHLLKIRLRQAIDQLPEHQNLVLKLFYIQDYNLKQISEILNVSVGTVKSRLFHAREKLKRTLKQTYYEN